MSIKAFFLDFYGTIVHEDGEVIKKDHRYHMQNRKSGRFF